jgi:hypothetical protein
MIITYGQQVQKEANTLRGFDAWVLRLLIASPVLFI